MGVKYIINRISKFIEYNSDHMPNLVIRNSNACYESKGHTFCNVVLQDKKKTSEIPASFVFNGSVKKVKDIEECWIDEKTGQSVCRVSAKGKNGGKRLLVRSFFNQHLPIPETITNSRSDIPKCDPEKDPYCKVY